MADLESISHQQWLQQSTTDFSAISQTAALDARVILCHCLQQPLSYLLAWPDRKIAADIMQKLNSLKQRRLAGEPIAYITGSREFWSMKFKVTPDVLIPRPETEILVEWALLVLKKQVATAGKLLELGTGSGAIAIALAKENPPLEIIATDISEKALQVASENAAENQCTNIQFLAGSWFECIADRDFDMILSNPPYVAAGDPHLKEGDLPYEPISALVANQNGLADIRWLVANARNYLNTNGWLGIEHGYDQGQAVRNIMQDNGYQQIRTIKDLADIDRLTVCQCSPVEKKYNE